MIHLLLLSLLSSSSHSQQVAFPPNTSILFPNPVGMVSTNSRDRNNRGNNGSGDQEPPPLQLLRTFGEAGRDWAGLLKDYGANVGVARNVTSKIILYEI